MPVIDLALSYRGDGFSGYARQTDPDGIDTVPTVQGELERALELLYRRPIETVCAGRTDAGVHARAQHVSFDLDADELEERSLDRLAYALNGITSAAIAITGARVAPGDFSARFSARSREYRYLLSDDVQSPVFLRDWSWWVHHALDVEAMNEAAASLIGEHEFTSFCTAVASRQQHTRREVVSLSLARTVEMGEECIALFIKGNAFLHNMVRIIVGTLAEVGTGRRPVSWVGEVLEMRDRRAAGPTAPARGLTFWNVEY